MPPCPPCKILLDDPGVLAASAWLLADELGGKLAGAAKYLARIATATAAAIMRGIDAGLIGLDKVDEAHAWSELSCHRATAIRGFVETHWQNEDAHFAADRVKPAVEITRKLLMQWAEEQRLFATQLVGGEYAGAWEVIGIEGIRRKE